MGTANSSVKIAMKLRLECMVRILLVHDVIMTFDHRRLRQSTPLCIPSGKRTSSTIRQATTRRLAIAAIKKWLFQRHSRRERNLSRKLAGS
jgi:hypothetical protein